MTVHYLPAPFEWGDPIHVETEAPTPLMTPEQAAAALDCSLNELDVRFRRGRMQRFHIGEVVRYRLVERPGPDLNARREYRRVYGRKWLAARRAEFFDGKACVDCGGTERLEIDHRIPADKVTHGVWSWSKERREAELAKCDVRCNACHKRRHAAAHGGERRYRQGCRCSVCVEGWAGVNALRRARNAAKRAAWEVLCN